MSTNQCYANKLCFVFVFWREIILVEILKMRETKRGINILLIIMLFVVIASNRSVSQEVFKKIPIAHKKLSLNKPLSQAVVKDIIEDERGFMWFATKDGLNRYDGYNVNVFRHDDKDSSSISNNHINKLLEDSDGNIWVATANGINKFDPYSEVFYHFESSISENNLEVTDIAIDTFQNIWLGSDMGLLKIEKGSSQIEHVPLDRPYFYIYNIVIDNEGFVWIGSDINIFKKYCPNTGEINCYQIPEIGSNDISSVVIYEDVSKKLWFSITMPSSHKDEIHTFYFNREADKIEVFRDFESSIVNNNIFGVVNGVNAFYSRSGELWTTSNYNSISKFDFENNMFTNYPEYEDEERHSVIGKTTLLVDSRNILWYGTLGNGAYILPEENSRFNLVNTEICEDFKISSIRSFCEDEKYFWISGYFGIARMNKSNGTIVNLIDDLPVYTLNNHPNDDNILLIGVEGNGLNKFDKETFEHSPIHDSFFKKYGNYHPWIRVFSSLIDQDSNYWVGGRNSILKMNLNNEEIETYKFKDFRGANRDIVISLFHDFSGNLWAGSTRNGLAVFSDSLNKFIPFSTEFESTIDLEKMRVNCIRQTKDSVFWIGTGEGLLRFDGKTIRFFNESDHLPNAYIYGIIIDDNGVLWLSTNNGICSFNPETLVVNSFSIEDGLQDIEFNTGAYFQAKDGQIFFGGINGFNYFYPKDILKRKEDISIVLTGVKWYDDYIKLDKKTIQKSELYIPADIEYFNIEFAGLSYINSNKCRYKYKIEELNEGWIDIGEKHEIGFHGLGAGQYNLQILASTSADHWDSEPFKIKVIVEGHLWESLIFQHFIVSLIILLIVAFVYWRIRRIKHQRQVVVQMVEDRTKELQIANENLLKANQTKNQFLSIISHDLRNPLGASQSVIEELHENFADYDNTDIKEYIRILHASIGNLGKLLENLLNWSRLQQKRITPKPVRIHVFRLVDRLEQLLLQNIQEKDIILESEIPLGLQILADENHVAAIFRNLLSNAIKFTPNGGKINIEASQNNKNITIQFIDNGVGISKKRIEELFVLGKIKSHPGTNAEKGTGLGLMLVFDLVKLNKGKIWVESEEGKGSTFSVSFPSI